MASAMVSTYCEWGSYGSVLQSIGLQQALGELGVDSNVVRISDPADHDPVKYRKGFGLKTLLVNAEKALHQRKTKNLHRKNTCFIREHVNVQTFSSYAELEANVPEADIYIAGSDQIWHPRIQREDFFLNHVPLGKPCITYAASMGVVEMTDQDRDRFRDCLSKFSTISVREAEMVPVLEGVTDKQIQIHIDPTFLRSVEDWRALSHPWGDERPYILLYPIYWDKRFNNMVRELKRKTGYRVISIHSGLRDIYADQVISDADVGEFLWLVDHAQYVITSSFHGAAFSLLFNKQFRAAINPAAPSRIDNLLRLLEVDMPSMDDGWDTPELDYDHINNQIHVQRQRGMEYLRSAVTNAI